MAIAVSDMRPAGIWRSERVDNMKNGGKKYPDLEKEENPLPKLLSLNLQFYHNLFVAINYNY